MWKSNRKGNGRADIGPLSDGLRGNGRAGGVRSRKVKAFTLETDTRSFFLRAKKASLHDCQTALTPTQGLTFTAQSTDLPPTTPSHLERNTSRTGNRRTRDSQARQSRSISRHGLTLQLEEVKIMIEEKRRNKEKPLKLIPMKYVGGALRLTRTPGRTALNTVSLQDLIHPHHLCSAFVFSFFIENDHLFQHFPFLPTTYRPHCPIYVGRDLSQDTVGKQFGNLKTVRPKSSAEWDNVVEIAQEEYSKLYGTNFYAFYPHMSGGCAHSKLIILVYPEFLRLGHHLRESDFPRLSKDAADGYTETSFEKELRQHLDDLECPAAFRDMHMKPGVPVFDFSAAKVYLVTSRPGSYSGENASKYGQLRLRRVVRNKILKYFPEVPKMAFEVTSSSHAPAACQNSEQGEPALKMVFPTYADVQNSNLKMVGNISSHINWKNLEENSAEYLKDIFYHYRSKDAGCLFHMKSILALDAEAPPTAPPLYLYVGSANFSASAWGTVRPALVKHLGGDAPLRLERVTNFECGVVVKGGVIAGMLETADWQDIVPYVRPSAANKYKEYERPFKAPPSSASVVRLDDEGDPEEDDEDSRNFYRSMQLVNSLFIRASQSAGKGRDGCPGHMIQRQRNRLDSLPVCQYGMQQMWLLP
ncbi:hypothetical protein DFH09DRAFT_1100151 [Mycena vulgaris]|nr:hypothetical protein DFH09DRAFT_1100151 [Mycena vulgaris]